MAGRSPWWSPTALALGAAGLALAVPGRRGRTAWAWLAKAVALRVRTRRPDSAYDLLGVHDLRAHPYEDRGRRIVGMVGDGTFLTAVVRVETGDAGLRPAGGGRELPLSLLADALEVDGIALASAQLVQQVRRVGQARGQGSSASAGVAPSLRLTWVALRLEPGLCVEAAAARGGGFGGAQRCLVRAADHVASRITGAGLRAVVLDQEGINSAALAAGCSAQGAARGHGGADGEGARSGGESVRAWHGGGLVHTAYAVTGGAEGARRLATATAQDCRSATVGLTVRRRAGGRAVQVSGHVRVSCADERELDVSCRELEASARAARVGIVRLDREQLTGVLATLPLGGTR
ncbi:type VII secretion protein EccE [Streptomyces sp. NPDC091272]|uniref:type VII secretion protein EccE n=1 Tax=Streptomyces sp. NPDC091272 TaxID=3365981 RepID=UPI003805EB88